MTKKTDIEMSSFIYCTVLRFICHSMLCCDELYYDVLSCTGLYWYVLCHALPRSAVL
jgi:hypothetical protein